MTPHTRRVVQGGTFRTALAKGEVGLTEKKPIPTLADFIENRFTPWAARCVRAGISEDVDETFRFVRDGVSLPFK